jgi:hypothetical protein
MDRAVLVRAAIFEDVTFISSADDAFDFLVGARSIVRLEAFLALQEEAFLFSLEVVGAAVEADMVLAVHANAGEPRKILSQAKRALEHILGSYGL